MHFLSSTFRKRKVLLKIGGKKKSPTKYPNFLGVWGCNSKPLRESDKMDAVDRYIFYDAAVIFSYQWGITSVDLCNNRRMLILIHTSFLLIRTLFNIC